jgi:cytochrome c-type biogenesis protein CcmH/NrfG
VLPDVESAIQALRLAPDNPHWMIGLAGILNVAGEYPLARGWIERALEARGDDPLALGIAGCIAANQRRDAEALVLFERAQKLAGASPDAAVQGYIDALRKGEPLPRPIGELVRGKK